jgi:predicted ester cyclase
VSIDTTARQVVAESFRLIETGDEALARHTGAFQGIAPTGREFAQEQVHIFDVADGRITAHRAVRDDLGLLRQLRRG